MLHGDGKTSVFHLFTPLSAEPGHCFGEICALFRFSDGVGTIFSPRGFRGYTFVFWGVSY